MENVAELEADRVVLRCPDGLKRVPLDAVIRWKLPAVPKMPAVGDHVKLRNTNLFYTIIEVIEVFEVPCWISGDRTVEMWARCQIVEGRMATWKLGQLEIIKSWT